jgi:hypothetical protein
MSQPTILAEIPLVTAQNDHTEHYTPISSTSSSNFLQLDMQHGLAVPSNIGGNNVRSGPSSNIPRSIVWMPTVESRNDLFDHATVQPPNEPLLNHSQWQPEEFGVLASFDFYDDAFR